MPLLMGALRHKQYKHDTITQTGRPIQKRKYVGWARPAAASFCPIQALTKRYRCPAGQKQESQQRKSKKTVEPAAT